MCVRTKRRWAMLLPACVCLWALMCPAAAIASDKDDGKSQVDPADRQLAVANGFFRRGLYDVAAGEYEKFLKDYGGHGQASLARYALAHCLYRLDRPADAAAQAAEALKDRGFGQRERAMYDLAQFHIAADQPREAVAVIDAFLKEHRTSNRREVLKVRRLELLYQLGEHERVRQDGVGFLNEYRKSGQRETVAYLVGLAELRTERPAEAARRFEALLKNHKNTPYQSDALLAWGQALEATGEFKAAAERYRAMIKAAPESRKADGQYSLAAVLYRDGQYESSARAYGEILKRYGKSPHVPAARYQMGLAWYAAGRFDEARQALQAVSKSDKARRNMADYWLARCAMGKKEYEAAAKMLDELAKRKPTPRNMDRIRFDRAVCDMEANEHEAAAKAFRAFRSQFKESTLVVEAAYQEAFCKHALDQFKESLELCEWVGKQKDKRLHKQALELAAENRMMLGAFDAAAKDYEALLKAAEGDGERRMFAFRRAECAYRQEQWPEAARRLAQLVKDEAVAKDATLREAYLWLGDAQLALKQYKPAIASLQQYVALKPPKPAEAQYKLGLAHLGAGEKDKARAALGQAAGGSTDSVWVRYALLRLADLEYDSGNTKEAQAAASKLMSAKPEAALAIPAQNLLAWLAFDAGDYKQAAAGFAKVVEHDAEHELAPTARYQRAVALYRLKDYQTAAEAFGAYIAKTPKGKYRDSARRQLAKCKADLGEHAEAVKLLSELANDKDAVSATVLYDLAWSHRALKQLDEAKQSYERLISQFDQDKLAAASRAELGELRYDEGDFKGALPLLTAASTDEAVSEDTRFASLYRLARCQAELGNHTGAAASFARFATRRPKDTLAVSALYQAGVNHAMAQELDAAAGVFARLIKDHGKHELAPAAMVKLGEVQNQAGDHKDAAATYQRFLDAYKTHEYRYLAQFGIGWSHERRGEHDEARQWYEQVIKSHDGPTAARAQFQIGETFFAQKQYTDAARELLKVDIQYAYPDWASKALYEAGRAYEAAGETDRAKAQYTKCVNDHKESEDPTIAATVRLAQRKLGELK